MIRGKLKVYEYSAAQEVNSDAHEVHDVQKTHMIAGTNNSDPTKFSVKFEPTDIDAQEAGPDIHDVHDVQNVNRIRGKLKVYEYSDERTARRRDREENINGVKMVNTVYKDKEVEEVKETKEVTRHTDPSNKQHDHDDYIIPTNDKPTDSIDVDAREVGLYTHDVHDVHNIIKGKINVYQYPDEKVTVRGEGEDSIKDIKMINLVYKDNEVNGVKETNEVIRHTDLSNKLHEHDDNIIQTNDKQKQINSNSNSNSNSNNIKEVYEALQVEVDEESKVQKVKESQLNSHIHAFAKEIIEQIIESYGVQEVHEVHEVTDVNTFHTPPKYSKKITEDVTGKKQESQEVGTTTPPPPSPTPPHQEITIINSKQ